MSSLHQKQLSNPEFNLPPLPIVPMWENWDEMSFAEQEEAELSLIRKSQKIWMKRREIMPQSMEHENLCADSSVTVRNNLTKRDQVAQERDQATQERDQIEQKLDLTSQELDEFQTKIKKMEALLKRQNLDFSKLD